jgi:hypothetical protein
MSNFSEESVDHVDAFASVQAQLNRVMDRSLADSAANIESRLVRLVMLEKARGAVLLAVKRLGPEAVDRARGYLGEIIVMKRHALSGADPRIADELSHRSPIDVWRDYELERGVFECANDARKIARPR